ncbi:MAG: hypothetical protein R2838_01620 [Caldilineaceae bacterium]
MRAVADGGRGDTLRANEGSMAALSGSVTASDMVTEAVIVGVVVGTGGVTIASGGRIKRCPAMTASASSTPLKSMSRSSVTPYSLAISLSVSPGCTSWVGASV